MNVLIVGSTGMLGKYMYKYLYGFHECVGLGRKHFDATDNTLSTELYHAINTSDVVINCVGVLKPHIKHVGVANTIRINSVFPQLLADECDRADVMMLHMSSDCIYTGQKGGYVESDPGDATDLYARTKMIEPVGTKCCTIRTSFVGEEQNYGGVGLIKWLTEQTGEVSGYTNCVWNGVTCLQLCKIVNEMIEQPVKHKTQHIFSRDSVTKYELCQLIKLVYQLNVDIHPTQADQISGSKIDGVLDRTLDTEHEQYKIPNLYTQLLEQKEFQFELGL